jgi:hypothetical protein
MGLILNRLLPPMMSGGVHHHDSARKQGCIANAGNRHQTIAVSLCHSYATHTGKHVASSIAVCVPTTVSITGVMQAAMANP